MIQRATITALLSYSILRVPISTLAGIVVLAVIYLVYVFWVFKKWNKDFSGHRITRRHKYSPSNRQMPPVKTLDENKKLIINNSKHHEQFDTCELLNFVEDMEVTRKKNNIFRGRAKRTMSLTAGKLTGALLGTLNMVEAAAELDMDHM